MGNTIDDKVTIEDILGEYKYVQIKVKEIKRMIEDVNNNVPGALKAICYGGVKTGVTNNISKMIENKFMKKSEIIDELEIQAYELNRTNRIIDNTLDKMGEKYKELFYYKYIKDFQNKDIARELGISEAGVSRLLRRLHGRMEKMLMIEEE